MLKRLMLALHVALFSFAGIAAAEDGINGELVTVQSRQDATQSVYLKSATPAPKWVVLLYAGGEGDLHLTKDGPSQSQGNFVIRTADYWLEQGDAVAMVDTPSDFPNGVRDGYRLSKDALTDTRALVDEMRKRFPSAKVVLLGTSRGTISIANILNRQPELADAYILTSTISTSGRRDFGTAALHIDHPEKYRVLFVGNKNDNCGSSPYTGGKGFAESNHYDFIAEESSQGGGDRASDCGPHSPHGYLGIESHVMDDMNHWLTAQ